MNKFKVCKVVVSAVSAILIIAILWVAAPVIVGVVSSVASSVYELACSYYPHEIPRDVACVVVITYVFSGVTCVWLFEIMSPPEPDHDDIGRDGGAGAAFFVLIVVAGLISSTSLAIFGVVPGYVQPDPKPLAMIAFSLVFSYLYYHTNDLICKMFKRGDKDE